ncbi:MAG: peptidoglycan-binding domain-containing protein, partial [Lysobacteraceae bacterium]
MKTLIVLACAIAGATALLSAPPAQGASKKHARSHAATLTAKNVNDATLVAKVGPRSHGAAVLRAQVLLDRAHFSPGEIDAGFGSNLHIAILGYQSANSLDATGIIDAATWSALDRDTAPVLIDYTLTAADVAGPFNPIPAGPAAQAKLSALGYTSSIEELGERFHASPKLLQQLNPGKDFATAGDIIV